MKHLPLLATALTALLAIACGDTTAAGSTQTTESAAETTSETTSVVEEADLDETSDSGRTDVPDLAGMSRGDALDLLKHDGLKLTSSTRPAEAGDAIGEIVEQEPVAGTPAEIGDTVNVVIVNALSIRGSFSLLDGDPGTLLAREVESASGAMSRDWSLRLASFNGEWCAGNRGFDDISGGTQITVSDATDTIVATGRLDNGKAIWLGPGGSGDDVAVADIRWGCEFSFTIGDIPPSDFYRVSVGSRGEQVYQYAEVTTPGFRVELSLG